jgi:hypothetical protein
VPTFSQADTVQPLVFWAPSQKQMVFPLLVQPKSKQGVVHFLTDRTKGVPGYEVTSINLLKENNNNNNNNKYLMIKL